VPEPAKPTLLDRLSTGALHVLPQHLLGRGMYRLTRSESAWLKRLLIRQFVRLYDVDVGEAAQPDLATYPSFNAFFTRALRAGARPVAQEHIVSPADGVVSEIGTLAGESLVQAKGHHFTLQDLLAGDSDRVAAFRDGLWATIYLSPRDYHRVHLPLAGRLTSMVFVPGTLFSVSDATAQIVPRLFARNERVLCHFETAFGPMTVVLVGAIFVGSIETVWHGEVQAPPGYPTRWDYTGDDARVFATGDEIGRFNMGSTVIVLLPPGVAAWSDEIVAGSRVRVGQTLGLPRVNPATR
jgi:phosphatidylserine decarboxylase